MKELYKNKLKKSMELSNYTQSYIDAVLEYEYLNGQYKEILSGVENEVNISYYLNPKNTLFEMRAIRESLEEEIDPRFCIINKLDFDKVNEYVLAKKNKVCIEKYILDGFNSSQLREITLGLINKIDILSYLNLDYDNITMRAIRVSLESNFSDILNYLDEGFVSKELYQIALGYLGEINYKIYAIKEYNYHQMEQIRIGLIDKLDVDKYKRFNLNYYQMNEIRLGLLNELDVSAYNYSKFNYMQMREIRYGLLSSLDVTLYSSPKFSHHQMNAIRCGLFDNLNVSVYLNNEISAIAMNEIRESMKYDLFDFNDYFLNGKIKNEYSEDYQIKFFKEKVISKIN